MKVSIPAPLYALGIAFLYGLIAFFWPDVPFDQGVFSLVIVAVLGWLGVSVDAQVKAMRSELMRNGLLK